jgi:hypothetical protein
MRGSRRTGGTPTILSRVIDSDDDVPAWQRRTAGESRIAATVAVLGIVVLQIVLPNQFLPEPAWLLPTLETALLVMLVVADPVRIDREEKWLRSGSLVMTALLALATAWSADRLVLGLINGTLSAQPAELLGSGGAIWWGTGSSIAVGPRHGRMRESRCRTSCSCRCRTPIWPHRSGSRSSWTTCICRSPMRPRSARPM